MPNGLLKVKTLRIFEILLVTLFISLIGMYIVVDNDPQRIVTMRIFFLVATSIVLLMSLVNFSVILRYIFAVYVVTITFLFFVLLIGCEAGGARRWIDLGGIRFQPSELLKFVIPLVLTKYYQSQKLPLSKKRIYLSLLIISIPVFLVLLQPDLGTAIVIVVSSIFVPFLLGLKKRTIRLTGALLLIMLPVWWSLLLPYQRMRIKAYLWPSEYSLSAFQVKQSICAIQNGGFLGKRDIEIVVPAGSTDFIFSTYAYEFGFLGVIFLLFLFKRLIKGIIFLGIRSTDPILSALAGSYAFLLICSLLINVLMVTGLLPVVGLPMPLMSYGGTAFLVNILIITVLVAACRKPEKQNYFNLSFEFRKRQRLRLRLLTKFMNIGQWVILLRLFYIYFVNSS